MILKTNEKKPILNILEPKTMIFHSFLTSSLSNHSSTVPTPQDEDSSCGIRARISE